MIKFRSIVVYLRYLKRDILLFLRAALDIGDTQSWKKFHKEVRSKGCHLIRALQKFENSILVAGCQRSGTTILARVITQSEGMVNYPIRTDDELDAALILSGVEKHEPKGRYCFQTTYLNECYTEYFNDKYNYRLIWVLRNPFSVVYSMKYNWSNFSFNELFLACGYPLLNDVDRQIYHKYGHIFIDKTKRACLSYIGKQQQALELISVLRKERMIIIEYDELVRKKEIMLEKIYNFVQLPYQASYAKKINDKSIDKANKLTDSDRRMVGQLCIPIYKKVKGMAFKL